MTHSPETCTRPNEHCWWHDEDEPYTQGVDYRACDECFHVYRTPGELRQAYRRAIWSWREQPAWWRLWRCLTVRARAVSFCQLCVHDF